MVPKIKIKSGELGSTRLNDWHHAVKHILKDLDAMQKHECLHWNFKGQKVRIHIPTMFIIGDIEGHDKLCSRKSGHGIAMPGVTHSCDIRRAHCDNANAKCNLYSRDAVSSLQEKIGDISLCINEKKTIIEELDEMGFYTVVILRTHFSPWTLDQIPMDYTELLPYAYFTLSNRNTPI